MDRGETAKIVEKIFDREKYEQIAIYASRRGLTFEYKMKHRFNKVNGSEVVHLAREMTATAPSVLVVEEYFDASTQKLK